MTPETGSHEPTHVAYADETQYNVGRYRGVALVSLRQADAQGSTQDLRDLLKGSGITELKCYRLDNAKYRFAALKVVDYVLKGATTGFLRVDTLTWDTEDSRHRVSGRDDLANLERMYYHLFRNVLVTRWPGNSTWLLCPDQHTAIDWKAIQDFLSIASRQVKLQQRDLFTQGGFSLQLAREFKIKQIRPCRSHEEPLVQVADLFVGLAAYSRDSYKCFQQWQHMCSLQLSLLADNSEPPRQLSNSDRERCAVLATLERLCKKHRLGVSLKRSSGLRTFDPRKPINFWWYEPQHEDDKAPKRGTR